LPPAPATDPRSKRIAILGAGAAGLCAAKFLLQNGFRDITLYEIGSEIGGMWCYENDNGLSSAYRTLHINTSRNVTRFHDFLFEDDVQFFPDHWDMHRYLCRYAEHFDITPRIRFNRRVDEVRPRFTPGEEAPRWELALEGGEVAEYDTVIAATGHLSKPSHVPKFRDEFTGEYLHSHYYREPEGYVGKRICIVGIGNSALDISGDLCVTARRCVLVARSGALIMPKLLFGIPGTDITQAIQRPWLPEWIRRSLLRLVAYAAHGDQTKLGFRPMNVRTHATSNGTIITDVAYNRVEIKHEIDRIDGRTIYFNDGSHGEFDVLIGATGYLIDLPFISRDVVSLESNRLDLYKRIVPPGWPGLYFMGFFNTDTALNMVFEHQARWIVELELGRAMLPTTSEMQRDIERKADWVRRTYKQTDRHTIEEEHVPYLKELKRSLRMMRKRAQS
jgi:cation diffusion facilitator CzcD-associated flavoprotein CzcO